jgi:hypothetical protein
MADAEDREGVFEQLLGRIGAAELEESGAVYGEILSDEGMVGSERALADLRGAGSGCCGVVSPTAGVRKPSDVVPKRCGRGVIWCTRGCDQLERFGVGVLGGVVAAGVFVDDAKGIQDEGPYWRAVAVGVGWCIAQCSGEDLFGLVEVPLEADEVTQLHERQGPGGRVWAGPFEDVERASPCGSGCVEPPELLLAARHDVVGGDQLGGDVGAALEVSKCCCGVAQSIFGSTQRGVTSGESLAVAEAVRRSPPRWP